MGVVGVKGTDYIDICDCMSEEELAAAVAVSGFTDAELDYCWLAFPLLFFLYDVFFLSESAGCSYLPLGSFSVNALTIS